MSIAAEMQAIVFAAAEPISPGDTVKAQQRRAWQALGRPPFWRLRAAWYGEADCWGGKAIEDMRRRFRGRQEQEARAREQAKQLGTTYAAFASRLREEDPDAHRYRADDFERLARRLGSPDCAVAPEPERGVTNDARAHRRDCHAVRRPRRWLHRPRHCVVGL